MPEVTDKDKDDGFSFWISGPEGCLDAGTFISYCVKNAFGRYINHKGGNIEKLFHRFHSLPYREAGKQPTKEPVEYFVSSLGADGFLRRNRIVGVVDSGIKECFQVALDDGENIVATGDHKFSTEDGYVALRDLHQDDMVQVHRQITLPPLHVGRPRRDRKTLYVKDHPTAPTKTIRGKYVGVARDYEYKMIPRARAVIEAQMNSLTLDAYVDRLNTGDIHGLVTLDSDINVHHVNENTLDDSYENLEALSVADHARHHADPDPKWLLCIPVKRRITEIAPVGQRHTYDIQMESPNNNFVANGFIVHNSGKTRLALSFPRVMAVTADPTGLDLLRDPENAALRTNLKWKIALNGLPLREMFAFTEESGESGIYAAVALARKLGPLAENKIDTFFLDGFTYLAQLKWTAICEAKGIDPSAKENVDKKGIDTQQMYDALSAYLDHLILQNILPLATRSKLNVIITSHIQRETENTIKGMTDPKRPENERASKRLVNLQSDLSPQVIGGFRQRIGGMPSAMIYLDHRLESPNEDDVKKGRAKEVGKGEILHYYAYCRMARSGSLDTVVKAKNRYGLGTLNLTGGNFWRTLQAKLGQKKETKQTEVTQTEITKEESK